jgi:four helix bundle protein
MDRSKDIVIFKKAYDLSLDMFRATKLFPKSQRFLMASRLEELMVGILEKIVHANEAQDKSPILKELSALLERLRILIRLSNDLTYIDFKRYERLSLGVDEIGRMLGGWIKYCAKNGSC